MTHLTPVAWRKKVQKVLGGKIADDVWCQVVKEYLADAEYDEGVVEGAGLEDLVEDVKRELNRYCKYRTGPSLPGQQKAGPVSKGNSPRQVQHGIVGNNRSFGKQGDDIVRFRQEVISGKLLKPEEVSAWIKSTAEKEGRTLTVTLNVPAADSSGKSLLEQAQQVASGLEQGKFAQGAAYRFVTLSYVNPGSEWSEHVHINKSGILG